MFMSVCRYSIYVLYMYIHIYTYVLVYVVALILEIKLDLTAVGASAIGHHMEKKILNFCCFSNLMNSLMLVPYKVS